jgi:hypothetical protein
MFFCDYILKEPTETSKETYFHCDCYEQHKANLNVLINRDRELEKKRRLEGLEPFRQEMMSKKRKILRDKGNNKVNLQTDEERAHNCWHCNQKIACNGIGGGTWGYGGKLAHGICEEFHQTLMNDSLTDIKTLERLQELQYSLNALQHETREN